MSRRATSAATLGVLVVVLCVMAVWGYRAATAPIEDASTPSAAETTCPPEDQVVTRFLRRGQVTVSVFNAGERSGRAQATMDLIERAGFRPGEVANAPDGIEVRKAAVYALEVDDPAVRLVAQALGPATEVVQAEEEMGPGVDVVIGDRFKRLAKDAPRRIELPQAETSCDS